MVVMRSEGGSGSPVFAAAALPSPTPDPTKSQAQEERLTYSSNNTVTTTRRGAEIDKFLERLETSPTPAGSSGRLIFALDATASRQPSWDAACHIQAALFEAVASLGRLDVQLVFYRGFSECRSSRWVSSAADLHLLMRSVSCVGGNTQIERVLGHAIRETQRHKIDAICFVGDAMEEPVDRLCHLAGELGSLGVPIFVFHEGSDPVAASAFKQMASLSRGAYLAFDLNSVDRLRELLGAIAVFVAGGLAALEKHAAGKPVLLQITSQLKGKGR